jgi:hypothetical protein
MDKVQTQNPLKVTSLIPACFQKDTCAAEKQIRWLQAKLTARHSTVQCVTVNQLSLTNGCNRVPTVHSSGFQTFACSEYCMPFCGWLTGVWSLYANAVTKDTSYLPAYEGGTGCSEKLEFKLQTQVYHPPESIQYFAFVSIAHNLV